MHLVSVDFPLSLFYLELSFDSAGVQRLCVLVQSIIWQN